MSNGLDVALRIDPNKWSPEKGDRYLDIAFGDFEWSSFFFSTLKAVTSVNRRDGEPIDEYMDRQAATFRDSLPEFPLLGRIHAFYQDAYFDAEEISSLLTELKRVESLPSDDDAKTFISGMLEACEAAISHKMGIWLASS